MKKRVTLKNIADELGVSVVTVSKALSGKDGSSPELREQIFLKADELGYKYSPTEKAVPKNKVNIGVLVADRFFSDNSFYTSIYKELVLNANKISATIILEIVSPLYEKEGIIPNLLQDAKVDGVIFMGHLENFYINAVQKQCNHCIFLDSYKELFDIESIVSDCIKGSYILMDYLIKAGHKNFIYVGTLNSTSSIMDRYLGCLKAMIDNGLSANNLEIIEDRDKNGDLIDLVLPKKLPDAFVCNCDEVAYHLVKKLNELNISVPEDVSVVGYDESIYAKLCKPKLTTYRVDVEGLAQAAVSHIFRKIKNKTITKGKVLVTGSFVKGESVKII